MKRRTSLMPVMRIATFAALLSLVLPASRAGAVADGQIFFLRRSSVTVPTAGGTAGQLLLLPQAPGSTDASRTDGAFIKKSSAAVVAEFIASPATAPGQISFGI